MKCPCCLVPTYVVELNEIELDLCPDCHGLWFDRGELDLLLSQVNTLTQVAAETDEALRSCPICSQRMDKVNIGPHRSVVIDSCGQGCGLWFDCNELNDLIEHLDERGWAIPDPVRSFLGNMFSNKPRAEG